MSTDRPEQYPEISGEESGLVPPQGYKGEWPKKIRTLTANELDRLTIDKDGRFYWDGRLVNYEPRQPPAGHDVKPVHADDCAALDVLDRAAMELSDHHHAPEPVAPAPVPAPPPRVAVVPQPAVQVQAVDLDAAAGRHVEIPVPAPAPVMPAPDVAPAEYPTLIAPAIQAPPERVRIALSRWQSFGVVVAMLGFLAGASGVAAYGWVAAHEWGCRTGVVKTYCPPAPVQVVRAEIPA
jgi:hypothetical protein